ncbi:MAG: DUF790 family protein [Candidatus Poribacteria bacterium]|nr:DUF790 family protein [Candidatus Poribacteria bacterium]
MLTTDLVRVRRRGNRLEVPPLKPAERERLLVVAEEYVNLAAEHIGKTQGEFDAACDDVPHNPTDYKLVKGLRKLVQDRCNVKTRDDIDPYALRKAVFSRATEQRKALSTTDTFDADGVIGFVAAKWNLPTKMLNDALYADLKENHVLTEFDPISGEALVNLYELSQKQAVLLRALKVVVNLRCPEPSGYRLFFRRLKFRRLLYTVNRQPGGDYRIEIDGPFSLFRDVTKYGLQLALLLPALEESGAWQLDADVRWEKDREPYQFHLEGDGGGLSKDDVRLPDEVEQLRERFEALESEWGVEIGDALFDLPGIGTCVPDLTFTHAETGERVHLEVMGYWSRDAVWKRVELMEAGLPHRIIFAVSDRLRVSEQALDDDLPGQLYVYKGVINVNNILERLNAIIEIRSVR